MRAQRREVEAAVAVDLEDLLDRRRLEERAGAALGLDEAAELLGVDARVNTFVPPMTNVASVSMSVPTWNIGPQFRYTYSQVTSDTAAITMSSAMHAVCERSAPLGRPPNAAV